MVGRLSTNLSFQNISVFNKALINCTLQSACAAHNSEAILLVASVQ